MRTRLYRSTAFTLALVGAVTLGAGLRPAAAGESGTNETAAVQNGFTPIGDFSKLVKAVTPAVVSIDVHLKLDETADDQGPGDQGVPQIPGFPPGFPFGMPGMQPAQPQAVEAKGAGFIIDANGTVVTNNHVVKDAKTVSVTLSDGATYPAKIIGTDPKTDLAVLRIRCPMCSWAIPPASSPANGWWRWAIRSASAVR
jgi:serine protease Do